MVVLVLGLMKQCKPPASRDDNFVPPLSASPHAGFSRPTKVVGAGIGRNFNLASWVEWGWI